MIRQIEINKLRFILAGSLLFLMSFVLRINLVVPIFLICFFLYLNFSHKNLNLTPHRFLNLTFLFVIIFTVSYFVIRKGWSPFYIPFSLIPMLTTILFSQLEISLLITIASSLTIASLAGNNFFLGILFMISGILSIILVFGVRRRMQVIQAGFIIGLAQALVFFFIRHFGWAWSKEYAILMLNGIASTIIVLGSLPVFEYLFKTVTNISLLELADFNHPLLQRMILEAPGTYHHSLIVGNLSEAASGAVGANSLLARIGAYYHDIGKLQKPGYFSENQNMQKSKHDALSATMSKIVIMNHVKEGADLAKKYRLNPRLIDFILQHHGNSLVYYFYRRALETLEEDQEIKEEGFRYPGPKPNTKEAAIVLLADSVEAATRTLKDFTINKIEEIVQKIINNKFIDGQLDECDLTLRDLEKISKIFIHILSGIYHSRITYPESQRSESKHNKSPEENSYLSEKDKKSSS